MPAATTALSSAFRRFSFYLPFLTRDNRDTRDSAPRLRFSVPALSRQSIFPGQANAARRCFPRPPHHARKLRAC